MLHNVPHVPHMEVRIMNDMEIKSALARKGYKVHPYRDAIMAIDAARAIITGGAADDADNA